MATFVSTNLAAYMGQIDLTSNLIAVAGEYGAELQDNTVFGNTSRSKAGGFKTVKLNFEGYWEAINPDLRLFRAVSQTDTNIPVTVASNGSTEGDVAHSFLANFASYSPGGSLGEMMKFSAEAEASGGDTGLIKGYIMQNGTETTSTNTTGVQLGAVGAGQKLYMALHVLPTVSGTSPTLDVTVESDDNSGFTSATTRGTFTQATAETSEWLTPVSGAITDDWWRIAWTIGGTDTPTFPFVVFVGIQ